MTRSIPRPERPAPRLLPAVAAAALLGTVVVAGVAGGSVRRRRAAGSAATTVAVGRHRATARRRRSTAAPSPPPTTTVASDVDLTSDRCGEGIVRRRRADGAAAAARSSASSPGPIDGQFGGLTRAAVWAFEKLVMRDAARRGHRSRSPTRCGSACRTRRHRAAPRRTAPTADHTEMYLPEQVVVFFVDDRPALITHMSSGTGEEWCEEVTISPGEIGNEDGTEPLKRGRVRHLRTRPAACSSYYRRVEGVRESALGGMWNPVYFNYGIAIHGALQRAAAAGLARLHPHPADDLRDVPAARPRRRPGLRVRRRARSRRPTAPSRRRSTGATPPTSPPRRCRPTVRRAARRAPADPTLSRGAARRGGRCTRSSRSLRSLAA